VLELDFGAVKFLFFPRRDLNPHHCILSNFQIQWDRYIVWLSLASRRLYNILYLLWLYNEFLIILYNILKIAELDCCQIIILSIYVPSAHAYTHVLRRSKWQPYNISVPLDLKVTKDTRLILNIIYVWKLNQTVLELDFGAVKFLFFLRRDLNPHHWYTAAPFT
jgi:hypothetical protein